MEPGYYVWVNYEHVGWSPNGPHAVAEEALEWAIRESYGRDVVIMKKIQFQAVEECEE